MTVIEFKKNFFKCPPPLGFFRTLEHLIIPMSEEDEWLNFHSEMSCLWFLERSILTVSITHYRTVPPWRATHSWCHFQPFVWSQEQVIIIPAWVRIHWQTENTLELCKFCRISTDTTFNCTFPHWFANERNTRWGGRSTSCARREPSRLRTCLQLKGHAKSFGAKSESKYNLSKFVRCSKAVLGGHFTALDEYIWKERKFQNQHVPP